MSGVEILASTEVVAKWAFNWTYFSIGCVITVVLALLFGFITHVYINLGDAIGVAVGVILLGLFFSWMAGDCEKLPVEYETHYTVTISESVNYNEFIEKYEVVDQHGKLFTIRER